MAKKTKKGKKQEQLRIKGTERTDAIPALDKLAKAYVIARDERMAMTEEEVEAQAELDAGMLAQNRLEYIYEDDAGVKHRCKVSATRKVSVRKLHDKKPVED